MADDVPVPLLHADHLFVRFLSRRFGHINDEFESVPPVKIPELPVSQTSAIAEDEERIKNDFKETEEQNDRRHRSRIGAAPVGQVLIHADVEELLDLRSSFCHMLSDLDQLLVAGFQVDESFCLRPLD